MDGAAENAKKIKPSKNWLAEMSRWYVAWDGRLSKKKRTRSLTHAIGFSELITRVKMREKPQHFVNRDLPLCMNLGRRKTLLERWPQKPSVAIGLGALKKAGSTAHDINLVSGPEFFLALCGQSYGMLYDFYLQKLGNMLIVQKVPNDKIESMSDAGFFVEEICISSKKSPVKTHFSVCKYQVGDFVVLISSEIDSIIKHVHGRPVELVTTKTKTFPDMTQFLHVCAQGAAQLAQFKVSNEEEWLVESVTMYSVEQMKENYIKPWVFAGQRFKYLLGEILKDSVVQNAIDAPVKVSFNREKLPVFSEAPPKVMVVPNGSQGMIRPKRKRQKT